MKGALSIQKIRKNLKKYFDDVDDFTKSLLKEDLKGLAEKDLIRKIAEIRSVSTEFIPAYIFGSAEVRFSFIKTLERYFPGKGQAMVNALMAGGGDITSAQHFIVDNAPHFAKPAARGQGNALTGLGVAAGRASGSARLIRHPDEGEKLLAGDVLVAPSTDPGWTPLFLRASAIVMEAGGSLCHGAIVAREYGIPAVVNIPGVMKIIKDGQSITVDGDEGKVYL